MNRDEIMDVIVGLSRSQGFYGRILEAIRGLDNDSRNELFDHLESCNFSDPVDLVMYFEC